MKKLLLSLSLFVCLMLAGAVNSFAYLDPTGVSYIVQAVAGVAIAGAAAIAIFWKRIRLFFKKRKERTAPVATVTEAAAVDSAIDDDIVDMVED